MGSGWQLSRIGLLDFWYYDEQEFDFLDGRMLLRGANGSGKSVTMQSFIPLLLDGNMRPERLDPFGSRARKMENYLLEEGDEREERTGYLYMELKKPESDTYLTIGIGIRARKNKKLDTWFFYVTDGRRVGRDFFLYKDAQSRLTLTRQELKNRIAEGGRVMETQSEYAQSVNRLLFGFETMEEYQEMIELLIQLRTPKLSKDFKPTVINEILSRSLQTLSEDDLRPMSEAIENMDGLKTNLDALEESVRAAGQIEKAYNSYNEIVLYDKAQQFVGSRQECRRLQDKAKELHRRSEDSKERLAEERELLVKLEAEESVLTKERDSLQDSDATRLKQQELALVQELEEDKKEIAAKSAQEQDKKDRYREAEEKYRTQQDTNEESRDQILVKLEEMEEAISGVPFDEFSYMRDELTAGLEKEYAFSSHIRLLDEYAARLESGRKMLQEAEHRQIRYDQCLQEVDECRGLQEQKERECRELERQLRDIISETVDKFYLWEKKNEQLRLPDEVKQKIAQRLEHYRFGADYSEIRSLGKEIYDAKEQNIKQKRYETERNREELRAQCAQVDAELTEWRNQKDPEPECSEAVAANRRLLREKGIPFLQFYKTVDFGEQLSEKQCAYVEEALDAMGVLDALIVPAEYRQQIRRLDPGVCDRYIFSDVAHVKENLLGLLDVDNEEGDILRYQSVANILSAIGAQADEPSGDGYGTWIDTAGSYRIGVVEGTITHEYSARYIGVRAREKFRSEKIAELERQSQGLHEQIAGYDAMLALLEGDQETLEAEWDAFPSDQDLKTAAKDYADAAYELERIGKRLQQLRAGLQQLKSELDEVLIQVREICAKCYLAARLDVFTEAQQAIGTYRKLLAEVQVAHGKYLHGIQYLEVLQEQMDTVDSDLDMIRYELGKAKRKQAEREALLQSVRDQLALTDYEKIKERLDACIERLNQIPHDRIEAARQEMHWQDEQARLKDELIRQEMDFQNAKNREEKLQKIFEAEYGLCYVEREFVVNEDMEDQAKKVCAMLAGKVGNKKQGDLFGNLQEAYHQNRGYLTDYQLTLQRLYSGTDEEGMEEEESMLRIDIAAKYRGVNVRFKELLAKLREDVEEQRRLLNDRDRELFEDILANTISKKIRAKIHASSRWVQKMNQLMDTMHTSSGLKLSLNWKKKHAEKEEQLDTRELVELLSKDAEIMREEEAEKMSRHFRSKIAEARKLSEDSSLMQSFHAVIREVLDYRKWFEFTLECQKTGEKKKELTDRVFFTFSGGEKAMAMYVPLFSAVVAKYAGAREEAPRLISLDEAFAGVDETNIRDMFRLMVRCEFNFMINSQVLWGDYDTVPGLAIYYLQRPENAKFVAVTPYIWNGKERILADGLGEREGYGG